MKRQNSNSGRSARASGWMYLAIVVSLLVSFSVASAQDYRNRGKQKQRSNKQEQFQGKKHPGSSAVITKTWVARYPYYGNGVKKGLHKKARRTLHRPYNVKVVAIHGRKFFVKKGRYYAMQNGRYALVIPPIRYRGF